MCVLWGEGGGALWSGGQVKHMESTYMIATIDSFSFDRQL